MLFCPLRAVIILGLKKQSESVFWTYIWVLGGSRNDALLPTTWNWANNQNGVSCDLLLNFQDIISLLLQSKYTFLKFEMKRNKHRKLNCKKIDREVLKVISLGKRKDQSADIKWIFQGTVQHGKSLSFIRIV